MNSWRASKHSPIYYCLVPHSPCPFSGQYLSSLNLKASVTSSQSKLSNSDCHSDQSSPKIDVGDRRQKLIGKLTVEEDLVDLLNVDSLRIECSFATGASHYLK